jgi:tryptophan synthase alpha chain
VPDLEAALRSRLVEGGRAFVPYVTGGLAGVDAALLRSLEEAGADAVEVGLAFLDACVGAGVSGVIVPDLPVDEADGWVHACARASVAPIFLAAPGTSERRLRAIGEASRGFVYCVATYGVTGERERLAETAAALVGRLRPLTDRPLLVGVGIAEPSHAAKACAFADGVVVGSAIVRLLLHGDRDGAVELADAFRAAVPA